MTALALDIPNSTLPQSGVALTAAALLFVASYLDVARLRMALGLAALAGLLVGMLGLPLTTPAPMGDYHDFVGEGRADFDARFVTATQFQFHLGGVTVREIDAIFGNPDPKRTFDLFAIVASVLAVGGLAALGLWLKWKPQVLRYMALVVALPISLLFFGYHEMGHLPLAFIAPAMPLVLIGIEESRSRLVVAGCGLLGVGAAFHGFGLTALGFALLLVVLTLTVFRSPSAPRPSKDQALVLLQAVAAGLLGWLVWVGAYAVVLGIDITSGHAAVRAVRPTFSGEFVPEAGRIAQAVFSREVLTELPYELGAVGAAVALLVPLTASRLRWAVMVASIPVLAFLVWFWPIQGLGNDTDNLAAVFPAFFAAAWLVASSRRLTLVALGLLVLGHMALLRILTTGQFVDSQIG